MVQISNISLQLLLICLTYLNWVSAQNRIVNGVDVYYNEFKFVVSLQRNGTHFCGGTILNKIHVLTAAHCVCNVNWDVLELLEVKFTSLKLSDPNAVKIGIQDVICHDYDVLELIKDIAILRLKQEIPISHFQQVKLADKNFSTIVPLYGIMVGWGLTSTGEVSDILQKVDMVVYNDGLCAQSYYGTRNIEHQVCSGWPWNGRGSCQGDSGGPLLVRDVQIGVISFGDESDCSISDISRPKVSARVSTYVDWINDVLESYNSHQVATTEGSMTVTNVESSTTDAGTDFSREVEVPTTLLDQKNI